MTLFPAAPTTKSTPCGRGCLATASLIHSAPPLRFRLHTSGRRTAPTTYALTSATIQGLYDTWIRRHNDTSTQAPPHTPSAARRHTTPHRLPWRSLMKGRAVITHQSEIFIRPTTHCFTEALMAELFGWAALLRLSSSPRCPGHLRYAHRRHRHACHDITPTCFRDMLMMQPRVDLPGYKRNVARQLIPRRYRLWRFAPQRHRSLRSRCLPCVRATIHPDTTANPPTRPHHLDITARRLM